MVVDHAVGPMIKHDSMRPFLPLRNTQWSEGMRPSDFKFQSRIRRWEEWLELALLPSSGLYPLRLVCASFLWNLWVSHDILSNLRNTLPQEQCNQGTLLLSDRFWKALHSYVLTLKWLKSQKQNDQGTHFCLWPIACLRETDFSLKSAALIK